MVSFISLFLSLIAGEQVIEVAVSGSATQVELRLDGEKIGTLNGEPWKLTHDFGRTLSPRELVAIALDAQGVETGRARLLINVPRARAGAALQIQQGTADGLRGTLSWQAVGYPEPEEISIELDGVPLPVENVDDFPLPALDSQVAHFLTAEVTFPDEVVARAWTLFGGAFSGNTEAELTAVAVFRQSEGPLLQASTMEGWFRSGDKELRVAALEKGPAEILMVRAPSSKHSLQRLGRGQNTERFDLLSVDPLSTLPRVLEAKDRFNVVATWTTDGTGLFPMLLRDRRVLQAGVPAILTRAFPPMPENPSHRTADAVAAAGRAAATNSRPRAVVLVLSGAPKDSSFHKPRIVRSYLSQLGVPLEIWNISDHQTRRPPKAWGKVRNISSLHDLGKALKELRARLDRQRIVWLEGSHLPQTIELSSAAREHLQLVH